MSHGAIEQLFYDVSASRSRKLAFREDADEVEGKYAHSDAERDMFLFTQERMAKSLTATPCRMIPCWL